MTDFSKLRGETRPANLDPVAEAAYWREHYAKRPYIEPGDTHDDFGPAYAYGVDAFARFPDRDFDDFESELHRDWGSQRQGSSLEWARAKPAVKDAWQRIKEASNMPPSTR
ncbi:hypothetical protein CDN99_05495 [Roseateles aquatilis]|uniref:Uncharacterized protein n=1 Tax=Roseateles aquatilis TaxID=431061 RepID=A0A246JGZ2_9BURK|nr:hypothetical protein [Roseateles aquatilis]OWQ91832.1 hypothetical protein CDN99_05495 [Roseateles aquatilis]